MSTTVTEQQQQLTIIHVAPNTIEPNTWNPNRQSQEMYEREKLSIKMHGFIDPITTRDLGKGRYQIIDGEHRWRAARDLELPTIPIVSLGKLDDHNAKKLTMLFNELGGDPEPAILAKLMADLAKVDSVEQLATELPFYQAELEALIQTADAATASLGDLTEVDNKPDASDDPKSPKNTPQTGAEMRRFVLNKITGHIPLKLALALTDEYNLSAIAVDSNTPEVVLADVLDRLKKARPRKAKTKSKRKPNAASGNQKGTGDRKASGNRRGAPAPQA